MEIIRLQIHSIIFYLDAIILSCSHVRLSSTQTTALCHTLRCPYLRTISYGCTEPTGLHPLSFISGYIIKGLFRKFIVDNFNSSTLVLTGRSVTQAWVGYAYVIRKFHLRSASNLPPTHFPS